jgi:hypothetical protein
VQEYVPQQTQTTSITDIANMRDYKRRNSILSYATGLLKLAVIYEHQEVADYLRSQGAVMPTDNEGKSHRSPEEEILTHLTEFFECKPLPLSITEIVLASVPMKVHIFPPVKRRRKTTVFVSSGLIEYALVVPDGEEEYQFAEYFIEIPGDISSENGWKKEENIWTIIWLKLIARYPHENGTYYGEQQIVTQEMIPELKTPDGRYCSARVERVPELDMIMSQDGRLIRYYRITPIKKV